MFDDGNDLGPSHPEEAIPELGNLDILTSGPYRPIRPRCSTPSGCGEFWPMLLEQYDFVLVDAPPVLAVADANILATQMDGVIMVARYGVTRKEQVQQPGKYSRRPTPT